MLLFSTIVSVAKHITAVGERRGGISTFLGSRQIFLLSSAARFFVNMRTCFYGIDLPYHHCQSSLAVRYTGGGAADDGVSFLL